MSLSVSSFRVAPSQSLSDYTQPPVINQQKSVLFQGNKASAQVKTVEPGAITAWRQALAAHPNQVITFKNGFVIESCGQDMVCISAPMRWWPLGLPFEAAYSFTRDELFYYKPMIGVISEPHPHPEDMATLARATYGFLGKPRTWEVESSRPRVTDSVQVSV